MVTRGMKVRLSETQIQEQEDLQAERKQKRKSITDSIRRAFATDDGKVALKYLHDFCGWDKSSVIMNPTTGEVYIKSGEHNESLRGVYAELRKLVSPQVLAIVEIPGWGVDEEIEDLLS